MNTIMQNIGLFLPSIGQLALRSIFSAKYMFATVEANTAVHKKKNLQENLYIWILKQDSHYLTHWYNEADTEMYTR